MTIEDKTITTVAKLARIHLMPAEIENMKVQIGGILKWVEQLNEVDTQAVEPLFSVNVAQMPTQPDVVHHQAMADAITQNAPDKGCDMFAVPKVVE